ncbi:unnamed protein product, partial [Vitis vinifera]
MWSIALSPYFKFSRTRKICLKGFGDCKYRKVVFYKGFIKSHPMNLLHKSLDNNNNHCLS